MSRGKSPSVFPLQESIPKFDFEHENLQGKLCDVWLQNEYQKLSIRNEPRENRKRYRTGANMGTNGALEEKEATESGDDMLISDTDCNSQSSVVLSSFKERDGLIHPPKRRLTTNDEGSVSTIGLNNCNKTGCPSAGACGGSCADAGVQVGSATNVTVTSITNNTTSNNPRTPNSPSPSTPEFEPAQLPLPSPSASPVSGDTKPPYNPIESQLAPPSTQGELIDMMLNLSNYLSDRNQNHLIFKLLQNVNRSSLSSLNGIIDHSLRRDLISNLPLELTYKILSYLDHKTLLSISRVCKSWSKIINNSNIWVNLLKKDKLITDDEVIEKELTDVDNSLMEWSSAPSKFNHAQILYKKRCIIYNRWMKPSYKPKRISVKCPSSKVVTCLQHDDEKIITGIDDKPINIYNSKTGKLLKVLEGHEGGVWALKYTGNTLVTGSTDRTIRLWNIATGKCTHIFRGHTSTIRCLDIIHPTVIGKDENGVDITFPEFPLLITGSRDHNIHVWKLPLSGDDVNTNDDDAPFDCNEVDNPYLIAILSGHTQAVRTITGYGNIIISGSYDSTVRVWDLLDNGACKHVLSEHSDKVYSIAMDFESKLCYSASMDHTINIWNFERGKLVNTLEGHTSLVGLVELVDGVLVSGAADTSLRIWDPKSGENHFKLEGHSNSITCFKHDGLRIVSGSERMLKLWDTKKGKFTRDLLNDVSGNIWQVSINYKRCIAAVQRFNSQGEDEAYIEILDFSESPKELESSKEVEMNE